MQGVGDRPGRPAGPEDHGRALLDLLAPAFLDRHVPPQALQGRLVVGVEGVEPVGPLDQRVGRPGLADPVVGGHREAGGRLLVRDGHAVALHRHRVERLQRFGQLTARHAERQVDGVDPGLAEHQVVQSRAEAVGHRVAEHAVDLRLGVDVVRRGSTA